MFLHKQTVDVCEHTIINVLQSSLGKECAKLIDNINCQHTVVSKCI